MLVKYSGWYSKIFENEYSMLDLRGQESSMEVEEMLGTEVLKSGTVV